MPTTYDPIASTTLASPTTSFTFSSIPATYTDLRLILHGVSTSGGSIPIMQFNSDTGTNYSSTIVYQSTGSGAAYSYQNYTYAEVSGAVNGVSTTVPDFISVDFFSYGGSRFKTMLCRDANSLGNSTGNNQAGIVLWRSTSAITSIKVYSTAANLATGMTMALYGIKNA